MNIDEETIYKILIVMIAFLVLYQTMVVVNSIIVKVTNSVQNSDSTFTISFMYNSKSYKINSDINFNIGQYIRVNKSIFDDSFYIQSKNVKIVLFCLFVILLIGILAFYIRLYGKDKVIKTSPDRSRLGGKSVKNIESSESSESSESYF